MQILYIILALFILIILLRLLFRKVFKLPKYAGPLIADGSEYDNLMPESEFWNIINETRLKSNQRYQWQCQLLIGYLSSLTAEKIIQFDRTFNVLMARS